LSASGAPSGATTSAKPLAIVWAVVVAPTVITLSLKPGEPAVLVFGPSLPAEKTTVAPAATAASAAATIGSKGGSTSARPPQLLLITSAPSATASSSAAISSVVKAWPLSGEPFS
jgi:hypothetical protein